MTDIIAGVDPNWVKPPFDDTYVISTIQGAAGFVRFNPDALEGQLLAMFASHPAAIHTPITWIENTATVGVTYDSGNTSTFAVTFANNVATVVQL